MIRSTKNKAWALVLAFAIVSGGILSPHRKAEASLPVIILGIAACLTAFTEVRCQMRYRSRGYDIGIFALDDVIADYYYFKDANKMNWAVTLQLGEEVHQVMLLNEWMLRELRADLEEADFDVKPVVKQSMKRADWERAALYAMLYNEELDETTKQMIDAIKQKGFNAVRIPVSWHEHASGTDFKISEQWLRDWVPVKLNCGYQKDHGGRIGNLSGGQRPIN